MSNTNEKYAGKFPGRVRVTQEEEALSTLAGDMAGILQVAFSDPDLNVDIYRNGNKRYARVLFDIAIQTASAETIHRGLTIEGVHVFCQGMQAYHAWMTAPSEVVLQHPPIEVVAVAPEAFVGNPADWDHGDNSGSTDAPQDDPDTNGGSDMVEPPLELETVDYADTVPMPVDDDEVELRQAA